MTQPFDLENMTDQELAKQHAYLLQMRDLKLAEPFDHPSDSSFAGFYGAYRYEKLADEVKAEIERRGQAPSS